jgi:hypothetical protein
MRISPPVTSNTMSTKTSQKKNAQRKNGLMVKERPSVNGVHMRSGGMTVTIDRMTTSQQDGKMCLILSLHQQSSGVGNTPNFLFTVLFFIVSSLCLVCLIDSVPSVPV